MSDIYRVAVIDDEVTARENLYTLLQTHCTLANISGSAENVQTGIQLIKELQPDIVFLDVQMQDGTGFDLLDKFENIHFHVIFTTAYDVYAVKAFRYNAIDYLLKPINPDELIMAFNKAISQSHEHVKEQITNLIRSNTDQNFEQIILSTSNGMVFSHIQDIIRLESYGNYCFVFLKNGERILSIQNLKFYDEILPEIIFFRMHQSHIINLNYIIKYVHHDGDFVEMIDSVRIPIARRRKEEFLILMKGI